MASLSRRTFIVGTLGLAVTVRGSDEIGLLPVSAGRAGRDLALEGDVAPDQRSLAAGPPRALASQPLPERFARDMTSDDKALHREALRAAKERDPRTHGFGSLQLFREANGESIAVRYRTDEGYFRRELAELSWFWRDVRAGDQAVWVEPALFDFVSSVQSTMAAIHGKVLPFILTSGYRTVAHNERLEGAARNSEHLSGRAGDFKVPGYPAKAIAIAGMTFKGGGVGVYPTFTHLDVGSLRCWPKGCNQLVARHG